MKKAFLWLIAGLVLLIGGGALAGLGIAGFTVVGVVLAVCGAIILIVLSVLQWLNEW